MRVLATLPLIIMLGCAPLETPPIRVIDGDTVDAGLSNNGRLTLAGGAGFDTPETFRPGCALEARLGARATQRLQQLVRGGGGVDLTLSGRSCGFGRPCGVLTVDGRNVGETLIVEGLAKRSKNFDWCNQ